MPMEAAGTHVDLLLECVMALVLLICITFLNFNWTSAIV